MVTGAYIFSHRDKERNREPVEFDQLTDEELDVFAEDHPDQGWLWAKFLAKWIRDNVGVGASDI